jgi:hypothetical protein
MTLWTECWFGGAVNKQIAMNLTDGKSGSVWSLRRLWRHLSQCLTTDSTSDSNNRSHVSACRNFSSYSSFVRVLLSISSSSFSCTILQHPQTPLPSDFLVVIYNLSAVTFDIRWYSTFLSNGRSCLYKLTLTHYLLITSHTISQRNIY